MYGGSVIPGSPAIVFLNGVGPIGRLWDSHKEALDSFHCLTRPRGHSLQVPFHLQPAPRIHKGQVVDLQGRIDRPPPARFVRSPKSRGRMALGFRDDNRFPW